MNHKEILDLIGLFEKSNLEVLELNQGEFRLSLKKLTPTNPPVSAIVSPTIISTPETVSISDKKDFHKITSPMVGTFYRAANPEAEPFIKVGDTVKKGDVLCIIEAMKMLNEIQADTDGMIVEIAAENGAMVDYGKTLFLIEEKNV